MLRVRHVQKESSLRQGEESPGVGSRPQRTERAHPEKPGRVSGCASHPRALGLSKALGGRVAAQGQEHNQQQSQGLERLLQGLLFPLHLWQDLGTAAAKVTRGRAQVLEMAEPEFGQLRWGSELGVHVRGRGN